MVAFTSDEDDSEKQHETVEQIVAHSSVLLPSHISSRLFGGPDMRLRLLPDNRGERMCEQTLIVVIRGNKSESRLQG